MINPGFPTKRTDYVGNNVYEGDKVQYLLTGNGRTTFDPASGLPKEEFFVKDHLGNVRSVVDVYTYLIQQYLATYELASANLENLFFEDVDEVRDDRPGSTWNGDLKSARLNGADPERRVGTSMLMHVMAGDKVELNVNNYYEGYDAEEDSPLDAEEMLSSIINTLVQGPGGTLPGEGHDVNLVEEAFNWPNFEKFHQLTAGVTDPSKPKAYLNYILFDEQMRMVNTASGAFQAGGNGSWTQIGTTAPMEIPANGYLAVYLSNSSRMGGCLACSDVFFDQLVVRMTRGKLKEESHYYPHGLPMAGMGSAAAGFKENRRKYQSNEYIKDFGLNWMDFQARQYDPQLGRFLAVDPLADGDGQEIWSPYSAMGNAPESMVDPNGTMAYVNDFGASRADAEFTLTMMFGFGNFSIDKDGQISILNENAARNQFNAYMASGSGGGSAAVSELVVNAGKSILDNHNNPYRDVYVSFGSNGITDNWLAESLGGVTINSGSGDGSLNVVQASARDIGRNDYQRWKADNFSKTVVGWMGIGAVTPFLVVGGLSVAPGLATSFLGNPAAWTSGASSVGYGLAGYGGEVPGPGGMLKPLGRGSTGRAAAVNLTEQLAMKEIMSNPSMGNILNLKKGMTDIRWPQTSGWQKMSWNNAGVEIHYNGQWENGALKAIDDFKFK